MERHAPTSECKPLASEKKGFYYPLNGVFGSTKKETRGSSLAPLEQEEQMSMEEKEIISIFIAPLNDRELLSPEFRQN